MGQDWRHPRVWPLVGAALLSMLVIIGIGPAVSFATATPLSEQASVTPGAEATTVVTLLAGGHFAQADAYFDPALGVSPAALRRAWTALIAQVGPFRHPLSVRTAPVAAYTNATVACAFARATADIIVTIDQKQRVAGLHFANIQRPTVSPPYVHPAAFHERAVTVGTAPWALPGTLTLPNGRGPFPAVVLVAGSGPADRDETIGPNKPFRVLTWGLASRGIAVLRYDKRTFVYRDRFTAARMAALHFTVNQETVDDALAAVALLRRTPGIDTRRIFVLGHSLGGMLAPRIGARDPHIAGLIILAGPTTPLDDEILRQERYLYALGDVTRAQVDATARVVAQVKALTPNQISSPEVLLGATPAYWLDLRAYHPAAVAAHLTQPLLIMQGAWDYQVTLQDYHGWRTALVARHTATFTLYPRLDHLFMPVSGPSTPADYAVPGHVAPVVVGDIAAWLTAH